ncbi:MAG: hypothetical protein LBM96_12425 [Methanobrevibacter sp.]|jgi:hypothetical protein|nr:hypothetical protein [Candidatus Methanoflexus mossambicus]
MNVNEIREIIEKKDLFKRENDDYVKTYEYTVDVQINGGYDYYNIQKIEMKEDEMVLYSPPTIGEETVKYKDIDKFRLINFIF